jgi:hypothetical protein
VTIDAARPVLVLGIGNILWADEGFGVRCVEELHRRWSFPDDVLVMDGGTQGLYLVHYVQAAKRVIVFDAIDYGEQPGTLKLVRGDEVPKFDCRPASGRWSGAPRAADRFGAPGSGRRRAAVRRRSGAGTRARRTGTDEPGRAEASGGRNRRRRRGCASRRRGPAGTGFRTRDRMPRLRSSACAASPGGRHGRSGRGSGGWTGSR